MCHHNDEPWKYNLSERSQTQKAIYFKISFKTKRSEYTNLGGGGGRGRSVVTMNWRGGGMCHGLEGRKNEV